MNVAILCTNLFNIDEKNKTGSGIFDHILINQLARASVKDLHVTVFASGESATLPFPVESVDHLPSAADPKLIGNNKHIMFELALLGKAFSQQEKFDVYHVNIGDGDLVMPFARFVQKPIVITLHNIINEAFTRKYFSLFSDVPNVHFVSVSNYQRKLLPMLRYADTIYHGIDTDQFSFDAIGGEDILWAGRLIPEKGADVVLRLASELKRISKMFGVIKDGYETWFHDAIETRIQDPVYAPFVTLQVNTDRRDLIPHFQNSKVFLLPTQLEEAFGLVFVESMACGTPVVTYARGAAPEVVHDGVTGFLVNPSPDDVRGDWVIKKTGVEGLREAIERVYAMPPNEYSRMRDACRKHVVERFSAQAMAGQYLRTYRKIASHQ